MQDFQIGPYSDFVIETSEWPSLIKFGFVRNEEGLQGIDTVLCRSKQEFGILILRCVPIIGNILGFARLYSVWAVEDPFDSKLRTILHTVSGILDLIGLGVVRLILSTIALVLGVLFCIAHDIFLISIRKRSSVTLLSCWRTPSNYEAW